MTLTTPIKTAITCILFAVSSTVLAQTPTKEGLAAIKESDLKRDLYKFAGDEFRGREFGTEDELKAATWLAEQLRLAGAKPAGDDGTFFQFFKLQRDRVSTSSQIQIGNTSLKIWQDVLVVDPLPASVEAEIVFIGSGTPENLEKANVDNKVVALVPTYDDLDLNISFPETRFMQRLASTKYKKLFAGKNIKGLIFIASDEFTKKGWEEHAHVRLQRGSYKLNNNKPLIIPQKIDIPVFWVREQFADKLKNQQPFKANLFVESFFYPSVNVIGKIDGTDAKLKNEHVLITSHTDHMGIREIQQGDSIYNGADDNGSAVVAMLAIARAYHKQPAKRSQLFISFGSEEPYLFGSNYYVLHPTVKKESIVAVLNGDLIGGNGLDSAAVLGTNGSQNASVLLTKMALEANAEGTKFKLDKIWDSAEHKEGFLYRSDHAPFLKAGIPALFYTSLLHPIYHTPKDDPEHINYPKLKKMTEWIYRTSWKVSNSVERPIMNPEFKYTRQ